MKILIDIGHPAHVHYYKNLIKIMENKGHQFRIVARDRSVIFKLLDFYRIKFVSRGNGSNSIIGKIFYAFGCLSKIYIEAIKFKPDLFLSQGGVYTSSIAWLLRKPNISTEDTENAVLSHKIAKLFGSYILSPNCFNSNLGKRHIKYNGYQELFYLHPKYFCPNESIYKSLGIPKGEKFMIIRFVDWNAHHDIGHKGISYENKIKAVNEFLKYSKVFILSDSKLPKELMKFRIKILPEKMHDALYYAEMLYGESSTMASESACLGTPAFFIDDEGRGYTNEEETNYGLVFNFKESIPEQHKSIEKALQLLSQNNLKENFKSGHKRLLEDKIDVTAFLVWFIEEFPQSFTICKNNPNFQHKFDSK